jgi:hypothetical protein
MFDVHLLVNPSYETNQRQSFFFDLTGRFFLAGGGAEPRTLNLEPIILGKRIRINGYWYFTSVCT